MGERLEERLPESILESNQNYYNLRRWKRAGGFLSLATATLMMIESFFSLGYAQTYNTPTSDKGNPRPAQISPKGNTLNVPDGYFPVHKGGFMIPITIAKDTFFCHGTMPELESLQQHTLQNSKRGKWTLTQQVYQQGLMPFDTSEYGAVEFSKVYFFKGSDTLVQNLTGISVMYFPVVGSLDYEFNASLDGPESAKAWGKVHGLKIDGHDAKMAKASRTGVNGETHYTYLMTQANGLTYHVIFTNLNSFDNQEGSFENKVMKIKFFKPARRKS